MRSITIIYDGSSYTYTWIKLMLCLKTEFKKAGFLVRMTSIEDYFPVTKRLEERIKMRSLSYNYDIVFLAFHHSLGWLGKCSSAERIDYLKKMKQRCNRLIWLDTADSTGSCYFDVLPYVDKYLKKQLLEDVTLYTKPMYQNRIFSDYYHEKYDIDDNVIEVEKPILDLKYADKLGVSWNLCLGDIFRRFKFVVMDPLRISTPSFHDISYYDRVYDIHFRGSLNYSNTIGYQRRKTAELVNKIEKYSHPNPFEKVPRDLFYKELASSKALMSPFGWGEVCFRDFEAFCYGVTLLKPSMKGISTYPNLYQENITYVPIEWDFSNLDEVLSKLNTEKYKEISQKGKELFQQCVGTIGKTDFVNHIVKQIQ